MKLVTGDLKVIEEEAELLIGELYKKQNLSERIATISSLDILSDLYYDVMGFRSKKIEKYKKNKYVYEEVMTKQKIQSNQFIQNFIQNKEFHNLVINDLLYEMNERVEKLTSIEEGIILSHREMYEIMREYLSRKNMDGYLDDVISKKRIFYGNPSEFCVGYMAYNVVQHVPHILINKDMNSVEMMATIVHEVGHIKDNFDLFKKADFKTANDYFMKSIYSEVISKRVEKEFLEFLIDQEIASEDCCCMVEDYYLDITQHLEALLILTNLDSQLLRREKHRNLSLAQIITSVVGKDTIVGIDEDLFFPDQLDLFRSLAYGYGGMLALYFDNLKKEDKDKYEYYYHNFLTKRANWFSKEDFTTFVEDYQQLPDMIARKMEKDIKVKQKIYHEN